jgi:polar amino acid transport system permease protein
VQVIYNRNSRVIPLLLVAVVWYTVITTILSIAQYYIERYYSRGSARTLPPTPPQRFRRWAGAQWSRLGDDAAKAPPVVRSIPPLPARADAGIDANEETR